MPATSVSGRPSISSVGTLPSGLTARKSAERVSLLWNDTGTASNGAPISLSAICGAIELAPGAKYSVSMRFDPASLAWASGEAPRHFAARGVAERRAAIHVEDRAGDVAGRGAAKEYGRLGDLLDLAPTLQRD